MIKHNIPLSILTVLAIISTGTTFAGQNFTYTQQTQTPQYQGSYYAPQQQTYSQGSTLKGRVVTVPAGVTINAAVTTPLSSEYMTIGQNVTMALSSDFYHNGSLIAPAGSTVMGTVILVSRAKHGSINGQLKVKFTEIITPYGSRIPISACIKTDDGSGILKGGTKMDTTKEIAKDATLGAAGGALTGLVASAISGGALGKGTAIMTGVGAGVGLAKSGFDKGHDVIIPSNANIELMIDQPITVSPQANNYDY